MLQPPVQPSLHVYHTRSRSSAQGNFCVFLEADAKNTPLELSKGVSDYL